MFPVPALARACINGALCATATLLLSASLPAAALVIDDFSTNQAALTLTYPPAGTAASSSVSGAGILGGERDLQVNLTGGVIAGNTLSGVVSSGFLSYSQDATISGSGVLAWDGSDGSPTVNPTGLGGVDLTSGGTQDALSMGVYFDDLPTNVTFTVYTDAGNASQATILLPGLVFSAASFVIPYNAFTTLLGTGADFANVGAITMSIGSAVTAPDVVIDYVQTTAQAAVSETVAFTADLNSNGIANAGDTLHYTVTITNPADASSGAVSGMTFTNPAPANTTLVNGTVNTTQGTVTTGNTVGDSSAVVAVGNVADGATVTITFDVLVSNPVPVGVTSIVSTGTLTASQLTESTGPVAIAAAGSPPPPVAVAAVPVPTAGAWSISTMMLLLMGLGIRAASRRHRES